MSGEDASYDDETLDSLLMRFEEPNAMTRWDSPLIIVPTVLTPAASEGLQEQSETIDESRIILEPIPFDDIWEAAKIGRAHV